MIAASAYPSGGNAQFGSKPSKAKRLLGLAQPAAAGCDSAAGKPASTKNLNNLLADDGDDGDSDKAPQGEQPGLIQQLLNFFFSKLWSPATSDAEKLGWTYVYAEDGSLLAEYGEGSATTSGSAQYLWLPTANGPMPIAAVVNGQTYAVHSDHLNTPRKLTQANGQAVWQWAYSAFGDEQPTTAAKRFTSEMTNPTTGTTSTPEVTFNLRYPGQYFDKETGLHYNYFRTYAPGTGRYTQADPIGLEGGWNRFGYVGGDSINSTDSSGLRSEMCFYEGFNQDWPHVYTCVNGNCAGWYPRGSKNGDEKDGFLGMFCSDGGYAKDNDLVPKSSCRSIPNCDEKAMDKCMLECRLNPPAKYDLLGSNCFHAANDCAAKCQINSCKKRLTDLLK